MAEEKLSIGDLVSSVCSFSLATILFGIGQISTLLRQNKPGLEKSAGALNSVTVAVNAQLDHGPKMIFETTDQIQRDVTDVVYGVLTTQSFTPRGAMKTALDLAQIMAEAPRRLMPEEQGRLAWQEFQNKLEAFSLFEHVDLVLQLSPDGHLSLAELTKRASSLGNFRSVWAVEGIGHYYAQCIAEGNNANTPLQTARSGAWPSERLAALHAGMGLAFASRVLEGVAARGSSGELRRKLEEFFALCRNNSHQGYLGAAYEALGLVVRNVYPHLVSPVDSELAGMDHRLIEYFWHGVGRAIYFAPTNFLPGNSAPWRAVEMARREPPHELGRLNALAGVVWSLALVNLRQPQILESFIKHHASHFNGNEIFENSLSSAIVIWRDSSADDKLIQNLCSHQTINTGLAELWGRYVTAACAQASQGHYLALKRNNGLGRVFRYRSFTELIAQVKAQKVR